MTTATKSAVTVEALAACFAAAKAAGIAARTEDDGGTCNFDSPAFRIKGVAASKIKAAAEQAGVTASSFEWFGGRRWFWLTGFLAGQGNCRARMSNAATKALEEAAATHCPEMQVCEYCQMD